MKASIKVKGEEREVLNEIKKDLGLDTDGEAAVLAMHLLSTFAEAARKGWTITVKDENRKFWSLEQQNAFHPTEVVLTKIGAPAKTKAPAAAQ